MFVEAWIGNGCIAVEYDDYKSLLKNADQGVKYLHLMTNHLQNAYIVFSGAQERREKIF
jgi:hypothetical protein